MKRCTHTNLTKPECHCPVCCAEMVRKYGGRK